jgi:hypothetical protein
MDTIKKIETLTKRQFNKESSLPDDRDQIAYVKVPEVPGYAKHHAWHTAKDNVIVAEYWNFGDEKHIYLKLTYEQPDSAAGKAAQGAGGV